MNLTSIILAVAWAGEMIWLYYVTGDKVALWFIGYILIQFLGDVEESED